MTDTTLPFHAGELEAQTRSGLGHPRAFGIRDLMPEQHRDFFAMLPFVVIASAADVGSPAATILAGPPGFIASPDARTLTITAAPAADDPLVDALAIGRDVGLLGIDLATRRRNRANGRIVAARDGRLTIAVAQSFGNCPQYIQTRDLERGVPPAPDAAQAFTHLDADARRQITTADTFFVATNAGAQAGANGGADVSHRGGRPGFVRVDGDTLTIPDFRGNRYFNTFGNLAINPRAALLFVDFLTGDLLHLQGTAEVAWKSDSETHRLPGAERLWRFHVARGVRRPHALALRWRFRAFAPTTEATGTWASA